MNDRAKKIISVLKGEIARAMAEHFDASDFGIVTVTAVELNPHYSHAKVFVHSTKNEDKLVKSLEKNYRHWGKDMRKRVKLKVFPKMQFLLDKSATHASRIDQLLDEIKSK